MRLGADVERLHHRARQDLDLLRHVVMRLHLALEDLDRGLRLALARHHREDVGDRLARVARRLTMSCGEALRMVSTLLAAATGS